MQFLNRLFGLDSNVSRPRREGGSRRRFQPQFSVEGLEERDLKTGITLSYGVLGITATQPSGNTASVSIDPSNQMLKVTLNDETVEFNQSDVYTVNFQGSNGGFDKYTNDTTLSGNIYAN